MYRNMELHYGLVYGDEWKEIVDPMRSKSQFEK